MRRSILFLVFLLSLFVFPKSTVFAQTSTPSPTINPRLKPFVQQRKMEIKQRISQMKASRSAQLADMRKEKIRNYWQRLHDRLLALIEREERLVGRMENRIKSIETNNEDIDLPELKTELNKNKELLTKAKADLVAANDSLEDVLNSSNPKEAFKSVRDTVYDIRKAIKDVHVSLARMIGKLRGLRVGNSEPVGTVTLTVTPVATPTVTVTPTP